MSWYKWFAWYPVTVFYNLERYRWSCKWVWLRYVEKYSSKVKYRSCDEYYRPYRESGSTWV